MNLDSLRIDDFSGGMTDRYIEGQTNQFQLADNFVLRLHGGKAKPHTRPGSQIYDSSYYQIPAGQFRLVDLDDVNGQLFQFSARDCYFINSGWNTLQGPTGNSILSSGTVSNYLSKAKWNKQLVVVNDALSQPVKIFNDGSWRCRTLGLPPVNISGITASLTTGASTLSYEYAFIYSDSYQNNGVTFREVGATNLKLVSGTGTAIDASHPCSITNIPVLSNGLTGNYNTSGIKVEIYRSINNGTTLYLVGSVTNGTTTFSDNVPDSTLINNATIYTTGGVVDFEQVDPCKYVVVIKDTAYYLNIQDNGVAFPNRVRQSIPGALYSSPKDFFIDLESPIVGGGATQEYPIVFCEDGQIYRIEGSIDDQGAGDLTAKIITRTVKLVSNRSIVPYKDGGLFFAAEDGFYYCSGFTVTKISEEIPDTYAQLTNSTQQKTKIYGTFNAVEDRIEWACQLNSTSNDNDTIFVAHCKFRNGNNLPFTTWSGGSVPDNFQPTCLRYFNGNLLRGDRRGYLFTHTVGNLSDPKIDTTTAPSNWYKSTLYPDYRSAALNFGTNQFRKWVSEIILMADNVTNVAIQVTSNNDNAGFISDNQLYEIKYTNNFTWNDELFTWNDPNFVWNYANVINQWRRFPAGSLRCNYKQVRISPSYTVIDSSSSVGTASSNSSTKQITLDNSTKTWFVDPIDYYISFSDDNYTKEYQIIKRISNTVIQVSDSNNSLATVNGRTWQIKGYKKDQIISLLSYELRYAVIGRTMGQV